MFLRRRHRDIPELNTTSTADISFMLLVFFLVTSSMDTDKGLGRKLPPVDEQQQEQRDISRSNVLQVRLDAHDSLFCDGRAVSASELQQQVESFVASRQTDRHIIAVEADRQTSYQAYFDMQNAIVAAYRSLRDKMARQKYGHAFSLCTPEEREAVMARYPQRISEGVQKGGQP
ncbi:MAG: biopolymer transporter ExbD [Prevotella sp.]|nr:biopolymer transporter ExbD [Prevotella sp.]MBQ9655411.1 biopolymer transporter ExbD [Prevotella sp.]